MLKKFPFFLVPFWFIIFFHSSVHSQPHTTLVQWQKKYKEDPNKILNIFNLAVSHQKLNNHKEAIFYYKKLLKRKTKLRPLILYYLSKAYLSINMKKEAQKAINLVDLGNLPPNIKKKLINYKNSLFIDDIITKPQKETRFYGNLRIGYGYNSNPQFISADDTTSELDSDSQRALGLNLKYKALIGESYDWNITYGGSAISYQESSVSNFSYQILSTPVNFYSSKYRFQINPSFSYTTYGGKSFNQVYSGSIEVQRKLSSSYLSLGYNYDSIDTLNEDFFYLSGQTTGPYLQWLKSWNQWSLSIHYSFGENNFQDSDSITPSFKAHNLSLFLGQRLNSWGWNISLGNQIRNYNFDVSENDTRKDSRIWANLNFSYFLNQHFELFLNNSLNQNSSNFDENSSDDKNYLQFSFISGLNWNF